MSKELPARLNAQVGFENIDLNNHKQKLQHKNHWRILNLFKMRILLGLIFSSFPI